MRVALLGTGLMGYPMALRLLRTGHALTVYNRSSKKAAPLRKEGARVVRLAFEAVREAQCVVLMLADAKAINQCLFGRNVSLVGKTIIQMGTISSTESTAIAARVRKHKGEYFECPVLGSRREADEGRLFLMAGATPRQFKKWRKFLKCFGPQPQLIGPVGKAAALKLALNQLIASLISSFALSLGFVQRQGVKVEDFMGILRQSVLYAPTFDKKLPGMLARDYRNPNFSTRHMLKDVNLFLREAKRKRLATQTLQGVQRILAQTVRQGFKNHDYCSLFDIISPKG